MSAHEKTSDPLSGLVYFANKQTGRLGLYVAYELEPDRQYAVDITTNGVNYEEIRRYDTTGRKEDIYLSWNIPDPGQGTWPRVRDITPPITAGSV